MFFTNVFTRRQGSQSLEGVAGELRAIREMTSPYKYIHAAYAGPGHLGLSQSANGIIVSHARVHTYVCMKSVLPGNPVQALEESPKDIE